MSTSSANLRLLNEESPSTAICLIHAFDLIALLKNVMKTIDDILSPYLVPLLVLNHLPRSPQICTADLELMFISFRSLTSSRLTAHDSSVYC